jgi:hypothetical protein
MSELFIDQKFGRVAFGDDREAVLTELGRHRQQRVPRQRIPQHDRQPLHRAASLTD